MLFMEDYGYGHQYTFASNVEDIKGRVFSSRQDANTYMYKICAKKNLHIDHILDDKHNKTYVCDNGVRFYIQRAN